MTLFRIPLLLLTALLALPLFALSAQAQDEQVIDEIVAIVGDEIVLRSDVDGFLLGVMQQRQMQYTEALWVEALNQLIDQQVLVVHAERDTTIIVSDDQVEQSMDQRIAQLRAQVGSEARLEEIYGKSLLQIKADLREQFRDRLLAEQIQSRKVQKIQITPTEVRSWFNQFPTDSLPTLPDIVRVAHIVRYPAISQEARDEAMEIITAIRDSIVVGGGAFEDLAKAFSDDPGSAPDGGHYGEGRLSDFVPEFAAVASNMPPGEVSQPFETQFGLHILRVNDRRGDLVDLNHILISFDESASDPTEAIGLLSTVRDSILVQGQPFELMAKRYSEEEATAQLGGRVIDPRSGERDLFLQALGPTWQGTLDTLDVGQISPPAPVELLDGKPAYHIIKLQRRVPEHRIDISTDYERIEQLALQEKRAKVISEWLARLREDVYIEVRGKAEDLSVASTK